MSIRLIASETLALLPWQG